MDIAAFIGNISLNISFVLYMIFYIPQVVHNQKSQNIAQLSLWLHSLFFLSYSFDLLYGFSKHLQWQYKTVSIVGLSLAIIQHFQLLNFFKRTQNTSLTRFNILFLILNLLIIAYFFLGLHSVLSVQTILLIGTLSRVCGLLYCFPQIIKNKYLKSTDAISVYFIYLNLTLAMLDTISSWSLDWGWPNKLAAPINIIMMLAILWQTKKYAPRPLSIAQEFV